MSCSVRAMAHTTFEAAWRRRAGCLDARGFSSNLGDSRYLLSFFFCIHVEARQSWVGCPSSEAVHHFLFVFCILAEKRWDLSLSLKLTKQAVMPQGHACFCLPSVEMTMVCRSKLWRVGSVARTQVLGFAMPGLYHLSWVPGSLSTISMNCDFSCTYLWGLRDSSINTWTLQWCS